jgi:indole-3-glycerol phosphate synthase
MTILDKIIATKRQELVEAKRRVPPTELERRVADAPPTRDFLGALSAPGPIKLIAEVKKASPSAGIIRDDFDPPAIAKIYAEHGAACISVLTDEHYFQGHLNYLRQVRAAVELPLLRKDFICDHYQLLEARAAGADAVLLIAECLEATQLAELHAGALELAMTPLVELYDPAHVPAVLACQPQLVGVNNRDLRTFAVDLNHTLKVHQQLPAGTPVVAESGIKTHDDVQMLEQAGIAAILVGESLMREPDIGAAVDRLLRGPNGNSR